MGFQQALFCIHAQEAPFNFDLLCVIDLGPAVAGSKVGSLAVLVAHAVAILDAVVEEKLGSFFASFPHIRS